MRGENNSSTEKTSLVKATSTHPELTSTVIPENVRSPSEESLPSRKNIRYAHSSTDSENVCSRHSSSPICQKLLPVNHRLILRLLEATPNQTVTNSQTMTFAMDSLSPRMRDSELDRTQTFPDNKVHQTPMTTSRIPAIIYNSQSLPYKIDTDACSPKDKGLFSTIILYDCKQTSEMTKMEHILTDHLLTINTACIKADFQKQLSPSPKTPHHENVQSHPNRDYVSELGEDMPTGRYFDALEGPELEVLKDHEQTLIPLNKRWPFLLRFPISIFGIPMGLGSQTILWKNLALSPAVQFLHIPISVNLILWHLAVVLLAIIFATYGMKCIFYFQAVRREYYHPVRVNYFFAPWISCMFLTLGLPPSISISVHPAVWCIFMMPVLVLELKIYGQWLSGGERRLSKVANPSTHLSVVGNFVGAQLAALVGWKEFALAFWAIGLVHYLVVFVTLYQRLPTNETFPKELHPVFFLFVAAPSAASVAWEMITGDFDFVSRIVYFLALFLLSSLVVRLNFFRGLRFSIAWWAYTFPTAAASVATIHYSQKVPSLFTQGLAAGLSFLSAVMVFALFLSTCHTCTLGDFFPNDVAIAITKKRRKSKANLISRGSEFKD